MVVKNVTQYWCCIDASKSATYKWSFHGKRGQGTLASSNMETGPRAQSAKRASSDTWMDQTDGCTSLTPKTVPDNVPLTPDDLLKMIKCSCDSATPCNSMRCGCQNANMACTSFCTCQGGDGCFNPKTRERIQA